MPAQTSPVPGLPPPRQRTWTPCTLPSSLPPAAASATWTAAAPGASVDRLLRPRRRPLRPAHLPLPLGPRRPADHPPAPRQGPAPRRPGHRRPDPVAPPQGQRRVAYLYRIDLALPKREATPAQLVAIGKALAARRTCPTCRTEKDYYIPRSTGECNDCTAGGTDDGPAHRSAIRCQPILDTKTAHSGSPRTTTTPPSSAAPSAPTAAASPPATSTPSPAWPPSPTDLDHAITEAITGLRARHGYSWADIGIRLGITRQAAQQRWGTTPAIHLGHDHRRPRRCRELPVTPTGPMLAPAPGPHHGPGTGANAAPGFPGIFDPWRVHARDSAFIRARDGYLATIRHDPGPPEYFAASDFDPDAYDRWLDHIWPAAGCTHPIRLGGQIHRVDPATGEILSTTADLGPAGRGDLQSLRQPPHLRLPVLRRDLPPRRLPAHPRRADRRQRRPRTRRRPSGRVRHLHRPLLRPRPHPARPAAHLHQQGPLPLPGRSPATPAATPKSARTAASWPASPATRRDDARLGQPLCPDCYDHAAHVVWNNSTGELWRRTKQAIERHLNQLARHRGLALRRPGLARQSRRIPGPRRGPLPRPAPPRRPGRRTTPAGSCPRPPASPSPTSRTPPGTPPPPSPT